MMRNSPEAIALDVDCRWFSVVRGARVDISRRPVLRRIMRVLVEWRLHTPGETVPLDDLIRTVWPGETFVRDSALNRLRVSIITLRRFGLREVLLTGTKTRGYHLDPTIAVMLDGDNSSLLTQQMSVAS
jgi:DNA-binding winged helix-turn-helix (wHTH) protein